MSLLVEDWVSRASSLQRRGRAGRVRPGTCYALFTQQRWEHGLRQFGQPEIMRVPLEELVLQVCPAQYQASSHTLAHIKCEGRWKQEASST